VETGLETRSANQTQNFAAQEPSRWILAHIKHALCNSIGTLEAEGCRSRETHARPRERTAVLRGGGDPHVVTRRRAVPQAHKPQDATPPSDCARAEPRGASGAPEPSRGRHPRVAKVRQQTADMPNPSPSLFAMADGRWLLQPAGDSCPRPHPSRGGRRGGKRKGTAAALASPRTNSSQPPASISDRSFSKAPRVGPFRGWALRRGGRRDPRRNRALPRPAAAPFRSRESRASGAPVCRVRSSPDGGSVACWLGWIHALRWAAGLWAEATARKISAEIHSFSLVQRPHASERAIDRPKYRRTRNTLPKAHRKKARSVDDENSESRPIAGSFAR
jgi:hypothetical protein